MNSVQTCVRRPLGWVVIALMVLGLSATLPSASAELPKPGEYKGKLTVIRTVNGQSAEDPPLENKTTFKAIARVDASGYVRIIYAGDRDPLFGRLIAAGIGGSLVLANEFGYTPVSATTNTLSVLVPGPTETLTGPNAEAVTYTLQYVTKLTRVRK